MTLAVQYLPPAAIDPALHYDPHSHYEPHTKVVTAETCITFSDYARMGQFRLAEQRHKRWIPAWALNEDQFKQVIMHRAWVYVHGGRQPMPPDIKPSQLKALCVQRMKQFDYTSREHVLHKLVVEQAGGYIEFITRLLWLSLRMGYRSNEVAAEFQHWLTPQCVRIQVYRANETARKLGLPVFEREHKSRKHGTQYNKNRSWRGEKSRAYSRDFSQAKKLGMSVPEYRLKYGTPISTKPRRARPTTWKRIHLERTVTGFRGRLSA